MPTVSRFQPGSFCWLELGTSDQNAAKRFYSSLFGWTVHDMPVGPSDLYTIFRLEGRDAAAAYALRPDQRNQGVPPHWMLYVAVESADAAAKRAAQLDGKVLKTVFDVLDVGRMAVVQDPTGATFCLWQAKKPANGIAGVDGTLCWADLNTPDQARARKFYSELFGWRLTDDTDDDPPSDYVHIQNGEHFIGGILPGQFYDRRFPPHWMPYIQISNCDAIASQATKLGGKLYQPPKTLEGVGRFAILADPQGASFAIFQPIQRT